MTVPYVFKFEAIGANAAPVGEQNVYLGVLTRAGLPVLSGFCLSAEAYKEFVAAEHISKTIERILAGLQLNDPEDVEVRTEQVRNFLCAQQMPAVIAQEILQAYYELGVALGSSTKPVPVAVRSSLVDFAIPCPSQSQATEEYFGVSGEGHLIECVKRCWGLPWKAEAVAYRLKRGLDHARVGVAVKVQAMIE